MKVGSCIEKRGKLTRGSLKVGTFKEKPIRIPVYIAAGKTSGKTIFISGGMHGNEINGIELVMQFLNDLDVKKLRGAIIILPVINILGYQNEKRNVIGNQDLNRSFNKKGESLSNTIARKITKEIIKKCSFGIDCHDSGSKRALFLHTRVHINKKRVCTGGCTVDMGALFGTDVIMEREGRSGMMAVESFRKLNIPVLTVEIGGGMVLFKEFIKHGVIGINNILVHHHMIDGKIVLPKLQYHVPDIEREAYEAKINGIIRLYKKLGSYVHKGEILGHIHNPLDDKREEIIIRECGILFSRKMQSKIYTDRRIFTILNIKGCKKHKVKPEKFDVIENKPNRQIKIREALI